MREERCLVGRKRVKERGGEEPDRREVWMEGKNINHRQTDEGDWGGGRNGVTQDRRLQRGR